MHNARLPLRSKEGMLPRSLDAGGGERGLHRGDRGDPGPPPLGPWKPPSEQGPQKPPSFSPSFCLSSAQSPSTRTDARVRRARRLLSCRSRCMAAHVLGLACSSATYAILFYLHPQSVYNLWPKLHLLYGKIWPAERC